MRYGIALITLVVAGLTSSPVAAQTRIHSDGRGYTYRSPSGNSTYAYRYDTGATYSRVGNTATYRDNTGTTGYSYYGSGGRYDSFSNRRHGWSGDGYTPYSAPELTTYHRRRNGGLAFLGAGVLGAGAYGFRRFFLR